jgi:lipoprotein-anchoring transpeptidase ErfK/SrfK
MLPAPGPAAPGTTGTTATTTGATATTGTTGTTATTATTTAPTTTAPTTTTTGPRVIAARVTIGGIVVGGMTRDVAAAVVRTGFRSRLFLVYRRYTLSPSPHDLGATARVDAAVARALVARPGTRVALPVTIRLGRTRAYLSTVAKRFDRAPVDSRLILRRMRPWISPHRPGRVLDRTAAERAILASLRANTRLPIQLRMKPVPANVTRKSFGAIIVIRRGSNVLYLYSGMRLRRTFPVATGERRYPTPLGRFHVVVKWKHPWWYPPNSDWAKDEKPIPPGPDNPLGTRWMGISSPGVGIHGTPNPGSIGYSVSHGCIRMRIPDAEWLFEQVTIGTAVFIVAA